MKEKLTSRVLPFAFYLAIPNKGWNGDLLYYFDKEENALKQARFAKIHIKLVNRCNTKVYTLCFETAEKDGTIMPRETTLSSMADIMKNFFESEEDYKNANPLINDYKIVEVYDWFPVLLPFAARIVREKSFNFITAFRYKWEDNKIVKAYFDVPTEYVYTAELGLTPLQPFVCPSDTYATKDECRNNVKVNVYRFGEKPKKEEPKTFYIIAMNGMAKKVNEDTYNKIKGILDD